MHGGWWLCAGALALGVALGACKPKKQANPPLCSFQAATDTELESQQLPPEAWLPIVSPSIDRSTLVRRGAVQDACGRGLDPVEPVAWPGCPDTAARIVTPPGQPVALEDLVLGQVGPGRMLAWAATDDLSDGDGLGPAALIFWTEVGLDVHATGILRASPRSARMRLHHSANKPVVIVESDRCDAAGKCLPEAVFVPIVSRKLRDVPLYDDEGTCLGRARFELDRRIDQPNPGSFTRRFELQRTIELADEGIVLIDLITGIEIDPDDPAASTKPFRKVSTRRALEFDGERFFIRDKDLWTHVLRDYGLVRGDGEEPRERIEPEEEGREGAVVIEGDPTGKKRR